MRRDKIFPNQSYFPRCIFPIELGNSFPVQVYKEFLKQGTYFLSQLRYFQNNLIKTNSKECIKYLTYSWHDGDVYNISQ